MKIVTVDEMRRLEAQAAERGLPGTILMENAGLAIARALQHRYGPLAGKRVVILAGPGNNGGDGLVVGRHLLAMDAQVTVYRLKEQCLTIDERDYPGQGLVESSQTSAALDLALRQADIIVDALLGTGRSRPLSAEIRALLGQVGEVRRKNPAAKYVALDLPTGLNADSGEVDPGTLAADFTITLEYPKVGQFLFPGAMYVGDLEIGALGIPADLAADIQLEMLTRKGVRELLPPRPLDSHKGTFGKVLVVAGSREYIGAACLSSLAAARVGTGMVTLATSPTLHPIFATKLTEMTFILLAEQDGAPSDKAITGVLETIDKGYTALLLGPGLDSGRAGTALFRGLLSALKQHPRNIGIAVDASGLGILAEWERWWELTPATMVLTPHPGEMSKLCQQKVSSGGPDRLAIAREYAARWNQVVVLKGAHTVIANPAGGMALLTRSNPALATAGSGDVLSGTIAGLLGQHSSPFDAARAGVFLHSQAGDLASRDYGDAGLLAGDLLPYLPKALKMVKTTED